MIVKSPITQTDNVLFIRDLEVSIIISQYLSDFNIDVSSYLGNLKSVSIYRCLDTGFRFYYPFNLAGDALFYEELQKIQWYYPTWKWENQIALSSLVTTDKVLDIGCGAGQFIERLTQLGISATGLEFNNMSIQKCHEKGLSVLKETIEDHAIHYPEAYDSVCLFQVLEHIEQPQLFITHCLKVLRKGGKLIIAVPNSNPYYFRNSVYHTLNLPPHHTGLWNKESLIAFAQYNDLVVKNILTEPQFYIEHYLRINYNLPYRICRLFRNSEKLKKIIEGCNIIAILVKK